MNEQELNIIKDIARLEGKLEAYRSFLGVVDYDFDQTLKGKIMKTEK